jgi:hypothetical protein
LLLCSNLRVYLRPQQDSNLRSRLRSPLLCTPLTCANIFQDGVTGHVSGTTRRHRVPRLRSAGADHRRRERRRAWEAPRWARPPAARRRAGPRPGRARGKAAISPSWASVFDFEVQDQDGRLVAGEPLAVGRRRDGEPAHVAGNRFHRVALLVDEDRDFAGAVFDMGDCKAAESSVQAKLSARASRGYRAVSR